MPVTPTSAGEQALLTALQDMLSRAEFLLPLVIAQRQFREHYYGLSSAALLEDLFHDALANYIRRFKPSVSFERPARGQKGWDYKFEGLEVSHKVGLKPQDIGVLWDATKRYTIWDCKYPIASLCAAYRPATGILTFNGGSVNVRGLSGDDAEELRDRHRLWLVHTPPSGQSVVLWTRDSTGSNLRTLAPFDETWAAVAFAVSIGLPINEIDMFRSTRAPRRGEQWPSVSDYVHLGFDQPPGISLMPTADLQRVPVESNNRAVLIKKATVEVKMANARSNGYFVPMPLWFRIYAGARPPDLFLNQRAEFDAMFSPTRD